MTLQPHCPSLPESTGEARIPRISVVIPACNEEASIRQVVRAIPSGAVTDIIVVDNGSTDGTARSARDEGAIVVAEPRRGYGHACRKGIREAMQKGADIIVFLDGDYSDFPEELNEVVRPLLNGDCDLVIGSRTRGRREPGALLPQAIFGNWLATGLIRLFWRYRFTDLGPFRAVRSDALRRMNMSDMTYGWTVEMQIKAAKLGLRCTEVPVSYRRRIGRSKVTGTFSGTVKASVRILYVIFKHLLTGLS